MKFFLLLVFVNYALCLESIGETKKRYKVNKKKNGAQGTDEELVWMLQPDGNGDPQVAILSGYEPQPDSLDSIQYLLFTNDRPGVAERVVWKDSCKPVFTRFDPKKKSKVLIHGFGDNADESFMYRELVKAYRDHGDYNLIAIDWSDLSRVPWYRTAAGNTKRVGERVGDFIQALSKKNHARVGDFEIIGFSLGSHVAGAAGQRLKSKISRITGLDPAGVLFQNSPTDFRLDSSDARSVQIVHTSGGYLGFSDPLGHRDFFPNGGSWPQPGCQLDYASVCSHRRAYYYFAEAVRSDGRGFQSTKCKTYKDYESKNCKPSQQLLLGEENSTQKLYGKFFLHTNPTEPFGTTTQ